MEDFKSKLQRNHLWLLENLDVDSGLLDWLYQENILSVDQFEKLRAARTTREKIRYLLVSCLQRRSSQIYDRFVEGLKCNSQEHIADELEKNLPAEDTTESQADENGSRHSQNNLTDSQESEDGQDGLSQNQNNCIIGFVHNVQGKRRSKKGNYYLSFYLQIGSEDFERCLSFSPEWHEAQLRSFQENRQPVCITKFKYMDPCEGNNDPPTKMITEHSHVRKLIDEKDIHFAYKEMPIVYTPLDKLSSGEFINVKIRVISQGDVENKSVKRKWEEEGCSMAFQEKVVEDEKGNRAVLSAWDDLVYEISPEEGFMEIRDVSVKEFQNDKVLSTSINTSVKKVKAELGCR